MSHLTHVITVANPHGEIIPGCEQRDGRTVMIVQGSLAAAFAEWCETDNYCPLCESHPTTGHQPECPLIVNEAERSDLIKAIQSR